MGMARVMDACERWRLVSFPLLLRRSVFLMIEVFFQRWMGRDEHTHHSPSIIPGCSGWDAVVVA